MESKLPEILDARGDQGALEIKSPWIRGLLHSDVDYLCYADGLFVSIDGLQSLADLLYKHLGFVEKLTFLLYRFI